MAERIRLIIDTEDVIRRAVQLRKVKSGGDQSVSDIINDILREAFAEEIAELEQHAQARVPKKPKRRPGRPKGSKAEDADDAQAADDTRPGDAGGEEGGE